MEMDQVLGFFKENPEVTQLIAKSVPTIMGFNQANKAKEAMGKYQDKLDLLEKNRQELVNPYASVTNPFANMQVATKAAEMQAEQADMALANTLDNLRQTGAGGATALAQAALKSKQGISADIQKQEANNQRLAAQGEQRMQQLKAAGVAAVVGMQERREEAQLDRLQGQIDLAQQQRAAGQSSMISSLVSGISGMSGLIDPKENNNVVSDGTEIPGEESG